MNLSAEIFTIQLNRPFRIAHGTSNTRDTILVSLRHDGACGRGEGALPPYYPSEGDACLKWINQVAGQWEFDPMQPLFEQVGSLPPAPDNAAAARVAWEIALHDLWAKQLGQPLWKVWNSKEERLPLCARTLPIAVDEKELRDLVAEGGGCFKLKAGGGDAEWDLRCVHLARELRPDAILSIDANGGWSTQEAAALIPKLAEYQVEYIEQPVSKQAEAWRELRIKLGDFNAPPLVADESIQRVEDIFALSDLVDGVNIKLLKAGGLSAAREWVALARSSGLKVMVGVMVETGIGRTAAAQLAPLADWLDIDPPDSIPTAPLRGFEVSGDRIELSRLPGLGLRPV